MGNSFEYGILSHSIGPSFIQTLHSGFPLGKYEYTRLSMGLCNSPDIFQEKMNDLIQVLEFAQVYIDDLLVTTKRTYEDHLEHLEQVLF